MTDLTRDELLASVFGSMYTSDKDEIAQIKNETLIEEDSEYEKIKKHINDFCKKNPSHESEMMLDWVNEGKKLGTCLITNDLAYPLMVALQKNIIPYVSFKKIRKTLFIIRDCDAERFRRAFGNVQFNLINFQHIYSYEEFENLITESKEDVLYIKNLSETQMEFIRQELYERGCGIKYTMFRMDNDTWGLGFRAMNFADEPSLSRDETGILEILLFSQLALNSNDADYIANLISDNVKVERACTDMFSEELKNNNNCVIICDPESTNSAIRLSADDFHLLNVTHKNDEFAIKDGGSVNFGNKNFSYKLKRLLIKMKHFKMVYSERELIALMREWSDKEKKKTKEKEKRIRSMQFIAAMLANQFARENENQRWFSDTKECKTLVSNFRETIAADLDQLAEFDMPSKYSHNDSERLAAYITESGLSSKQLSDAAHGLGGLDIGAISSKLEISKDSLRDFLIEAKLQPHQMERAAQNLVKENEIRGE